MSFFPSIMQWFHWWFSERVCCERLWFKPLTHEHWWVWTRIMNLFDWLIKKRTGTESFVQKRLSKTTKLISALCFRLLLMLEKLTQICFHILIINTKSCFSIQMIGYVFQDSVNEALCWKVCCVRSLRCEIDLWILSCSFLVWKRRDRPHMGCERE